MYIRGRNSFFKLEILGYEFPESTDKYDSNWLNVSVECLHCDTRWKQTGCYLRTIELVELFEWLSCILRDEDYSHRLSFTEHEIAFEYDSKIGEITICLDFDCHPRGGQYRLNVDKEYRMAFNISNKDTRALTQKVVQLMEKFPVRNLSH